MKTNFQNGTIVTPEFLNAINTPVWKQAPANDGEFKPPVLGDMPDVQSAIAGMAQAIPDVCAVDLTACVAYRAGSGDVDVLLSSLIDVPNSHMRLRAVSSYGLYMISFFLKFNALVNNGNAFYIKVPESAFQARPWLASFLTSLYGGIDTSGTIGTYGQEYAKQAFLLPDDPANEVGIYTSPWAAWSDVVPGASLVVGSFTLVG
jgi:hypothetical protein